MASSVRENEQTPPEESSEDLSLKDSKSVLSSSEGSESDGVEPMVSEGPTGENVATAVAEGPTSEYVAAAVGEGPTSEIVATTIGEGIVSEKVVGVVGEGPVSETAIVIVGERPISRLDDSLTKGHVKDSPVKVDEGPCNNSTVKDGEAPLNKSIVLVGDGSVSNSIVNVGEGTVSNSVVRVPPEKRSLYKFGQRTSNFRGVTRHRWTGKYEAHLWDNSTITEGRKRKGKQVYLGGYESETKAAQAYDLAALKYWGASANTKLNFPISTYEKELEEMKDMSREEYVNSLRRKSICFTRGHSIYRGVTREYAEKGENGPGDGGETAVRFDARPVGF